MHQTLRVLRMVRVTITRVNGTHHWQVQHAGQLCCPCLASALCIDSSLQWKQRGREISNSHSILKNNIFLIAVTLKYPNSALGSKLWQENKLKCKVNPYLFLMFFLQLCLQPHSCHFSSPSKFPLYQKADRFSS